ncbi:MAG: hypothetical protein AB1445_11495 [Bacillota bacterium]
MLTVPELLAKRAQIYRKHPGRTISDYSQAVAFLAETGLLLPWDRVGVELPSLRGAMKGPFQREPGPAWTYKDRMINEKHAVYGHLVPPGVILVHPDWFPQLYAASGRAGEEEEYLDAYRLGALSAAARRILDLLRWQPPLGTAALRAAVGMDGQDLRGAFAKALREVQEQLYALPVGVSPETDRNYTYYWGLVDQWHSGAVEKAAGLTTLEASRQLLVLYVRSVVFLEQERVARFFGWPKARFAAALKLAQADIAVWDRPDGKKGSWLVDRAALEP